MKLIRRGTLAAVALSLPFAMAACGSADDEPSTSASPSEDMSMGASPSEDMSMGASPSEEMSMGMAGAEPFGPGCAAVPADGAGSFDGMAKDPVVTAASNNPALKTLVSAVGAAGLSDTLNSAQDITVFAPSDDAFSAVPKATLDGAMADPKGVLTKVLQNHVVQGKLTPEDLAGEHTTRGGGKITVEGSGEDFTVGTAKVVCGNVQTANATVYIIDGVLLPAS